MAVEADDEAAEREGIAIVVSIWPEVCRADAEFHVDAVGNGSVGLGVSV